MSYSYVGRLKFTYEKTFTMQFIGTYRYDGYSGKNGQYIYNIVTDAKCVKSLVYHVPFLGSHRRKQQKEFGNTYQFYLWKSPGRKH